MGTGAGMHIRTAVWVAIGSGMIVAPPMAWGACGAGNIVRDWGLHLQWRVERDSNHPERPPALVEIPWSSTTTVHDRDQAVCASSLRNPGRPDAGKPVSLPAPEVRFGMRVTAWQEDENADIHLRGTALGTAFRGEKVSVKAGLGGAVLEGIVRGPGLVELLPQKGGK